MATRPRVAMPSKLAERLYVGSSGRSGYATEAILDDFLIHQRSRTQC